jgi:hypothetical protein
MAEIATFRKTGWLPTFGLTEGQYYYMMRNEESCDVLTSEDWLHLRGALRGRCTGCDTRTSADWLHLLGAVHCHCTVCYARTSAD